jgi:cysteine desulfurase
MAGVGNMEHLRRVIYLDYNATTPIFPEVAEAMRPYTFEEFG